MSELKYEDLDSVIKNADSSLVQLLAIQLKKNMEALQKSENSESQLIDERDHAEGAIADMYNAAIGKQPEWSNWFGFSDAVVEVGDEVHDLRQRISKSEQLLEGVASEAIDGGWTAKGLSDYAKSLQQQLTATTNSLANAQEALKSAGIEADTVQAGVMELKAQRDALAAENAALVAEVVNIREQAEDVYAAGYRQGHLNTADGIAYAPGVEDEFYHNAIQVMAEVETPATEACLNAVRAEGVEMFARKCSEKSKHADSSDMRDSWWLSGENAADFAAKLRAGNAGKDGSHE